jgi:hypothetical protein
LTKWIICVIIKIQKRKTKGDTTMINTYYITNKITGQTAKIYGRTSAEARLNACAPVGEWELTFMVFGKQ